MNESNEIKRLTAEVENLHKLFKILSERVDAHSETLKAMSSRITVAHDRIDIIVNSRRGLK